MQEILALLIVLLTIALMARSWLRNRRSPTAACGNGCHCASGQKEIRYREERREPTTWMSKKLLP